MSEYDSVDLSMDIMVGGRGRRRGTRRGPMDEMRQLVRILVKIIPQSFPYLATTEDGGGNRISEEQIKFYLDKTLGAAPRPEWGLPQGWGYYLASAFLVVKASLLLLKCCCSVPITCCAALFRWATGRDFSQEEARQCAKRLPGRSWEAVEPVLDRFKLRPHTWKLPLQQVDEPVDGLYVLAEDNQARKHPAEPEDYQRVWFPQNSAPAGPVLCRPCSRPMQQTYIAIKLNTPCLCSQGKCVSACLICLVWMGCQS